MQQIEARAILSAADKTGGIFSMIANKIRGMNSAAVMANRNTAMAGNAAVISASRANAANMAIMGAATRVLAPAALVGVAGKAYTNFAKTDLAVRRIGITADASEEQVNGLMTKLRELAYSTGKPMAEVTKGLESLVAGGMDLPEAMPALPAIAKTAQAAGAEIEDMSTTTLALNQNLGIATDKMQNAFDILVKGGKAGKFELKDMARYFPSIAPAAVAAGMKGEEGLMRIVAALQTIRAGTGTTEEAAASMQNIFAKMESETTTKKFKEFGIDLRKEMAQARKEGKDLLEVFVDMTQRATKGDLSKIPQLFSDMEFARGMRAMMSFRDLNKKVLGELKQSIGSTQKDFEKIMNTPAIALERMKESSDRLITSIGYGIDVLSKKMGGQGGLAQGMEDAAKIIEEVANKGLGPPVERMTTDIADVNRQRQILELENSLMRRRDLVERARARGSEISPDRAQQMIEDTSKLLQLYSEIASKSDKPLFSDEEVEKWRSMPLEGRVPMPTADPRKRKGYAPTPTADPRKVGYGSELPPVQPLDDVVSAIKSMDVKAELTGTAEVQGKTEVTVKVEAGSELLRIVDSVKSAIANMAGRLSANGPGSTGRSSPDAVPHNVGTNVGAP